ncbi:hypothetical protein HYC85_029018 [Camellia sinensis]|uniref:Uncharacterized protein n=1 Tax=Camellia sinensis TaxID=4442 RepID=A0A7J7FXH5_CAMSI|nr:hypothetical protein HYC85_029018 [Camellia sinensis]
MAQILENIANTFLSLQRSIVAIANTVSTHSDALAKLQHQSRMSTVQPPLVTHPDPPPPAHANSSKTNTVIAATTTIANPFGNTGPQTVELTRPPKKPFHLLHMSPTHAMEILVEKGHLKLLDPRPLPDILLARHDPNKYFTFHQQHGHETHRCFCLHHEIQDLINSKAIGPPQPQRPKVIIPPKKSTKSIDDGLINLGDNATSSVIGG